MFPSPAIRRAVGWPANFVSPALDTMRAMAGSLAQALISELERESKATAVILARVPKEFADWRPHAKSMSLGQLAWHVATIPAGVARLVLAGKFDVSNARPSSPGHDDYSRALAESVAAAKEAIVAVDEKDGLRAPFTITKDGQTVQEFPTIGAIRSMMLNHSYHHRGQLTVYLRLLDVPVPATYGTSADEGL
jgi:uncharacterized damage-inducible protein DinB